MSVDDNIFDIVKFRSRKVIGIDDRRMIGSMVKMDEYAKMVDDDDEVDALESRDVEELAAHRMDRMGARHKISRDPSRHDMLRVQRLVLLTFFLGYSDYRKSC